MSIESSILLNEEQRGSHHLEALVDPRKINNVGHDLKVKHNFESPSLFKKLISATSRENIILYGLITGEEAISIDQTKGNVLIPVINREQLRDNVSKTLNVKERTKIGYIHISTIQIILKSTFSMGISAPITLEISDDRFFDPSNALIAQGGGDLAYGKIKFNVNYQVSMSLNDNQLERSITLRYKLLKPQLMKSGNHPFTITYRVNYALTNSHHSLSFKPGEKIEIETLFSPIVQFESPNRTMQFTNLASSSRQIQDTNLVSESKRFKNFGLGGEDNPEKDQNTNLVLKQDINLNPDRLSNNNHRIQEISRELGLRS